MKSCPEVIQLRLGVPFFASELLADAIRRSIAGKRRAAPDARRDLLAEREVVIVFLCRSASVGDDSRAPEMIRRQVARANG